VSGPLPRSDHHLLSCLVSYPELSTTDVQAGFLGRHLGLALPTTAARLFCVGSLMPGSPGGGRPKKYWPLHEVFEVMRSCYCGRLTMEYKHLFQQVGGLC